MFTYHRLSPSKRILTIVLLCAGLSAIRFAAADGRPGQTQEAPPAAGTRTERLPGVGRKIVRELAGGQKHSYQLKLAAGQFARIAVEQLGIDVTLRVMDEQGAILVETDRPNGYCGPEEALLAPNAAATLTVEVAALENPAPQGRYQVRVAERRRAVRLDALRMAAQRETQAGRQLLNRNEPEAPGNAAGRLEQAVKQWQATGEAESEAYTRLLLASALIKLNEAQKAREQVQLVLKRWEDRGETQGQAVALNYLGDIETLSGQPEGKRLALEYYERALPLSHKVGDQLAEMNTLYNIGKLYLDLGEKLKASDHYERGAALALAWTTGLGELQAKVFYALAEFYKSLGEKQKALDHYRRTLPLLEPIEGITNKLGAADLLATIGGATAAMDEPREALKYYQATLSIGRAIDNKAVQANQLYNIGITYAKLHENREALKYYQEVLALNRLLDDRSLEVAVLYSLGLIYTRMGDHREALKRYEDALSVIRAAKIQTLSETSILDSIGGAYRGLGDHRKALDFYHQALRIEPVGGLDTNSRAITLINIGQELAEMGEDRQAVEYYERAFSISRVLYEQKSVIQLPVDLRTLALNLIGQRYTDMGENEKALDSYQQALRISRETENKKEEADALLSIGEIYDRLGAKQLALEFSERALTISRDLPDHAVLILTLNHLGTIYSDSGDRRKALAYFEEALSISRSDPEKMHEAVTLNNLGVLWFHLGDMRKALAYYEQSVQLSRNTPMKTGATISNIGSVYNELGANQKAMENFNEALRYSRAENDHAREGDAILGIGMVHYDLGDKRKAMDYYEQALRIFLELKDLSGEARARIDLGAVNYDLGENRKALDYFEEGLALTRKAGIRRLETTALTQVGKAYEALGERQKALDYYHQALLLRRGEEDLMGVALSFNRLMKFWKNDNPRLAVFYGKQSVNLFQQMRSNIKDLDQTIQQSFLKSHEETYRMLADLLIAQGRLPEAQQALDMLKEEEYFTYIRRDRNEAAGLGGRAALTPAEALLEKEYGEIADEVASLGRELDELNRLKDPTPAQLARRAEIDRRLKIAAERFQSYLKRLAQELGDTKKAGERMEMIRASEGLQDTLRELGPGTVALHTVVGEDRYSVILTTANGPPVAAETVISRNELNRKIFAFRDALKNPEVDPRPLASELYDILIGPVAKNLAGAKAKVLMFSLDWALRYAPMAALYDKTRGEYLNERYQTVIYTPAGASDLKNSVSADWKGLGFGVSTEIKNPEIGEFVALESVPAELRAVIRDGDGRDGDGKDGVIEGRIFLNSQFTEQQFMDALRPQQYPLVHIASHFVFRPGDGLKSFLLLGDGRPLTLETINNTYNLFRGVELLTLSACETGIGEENERGAEIEGFGVMAQKKGAKAVLATLWNVADASTGRLMREFYRLRASKPGITKAEALQQAQLSLLRGQSQKGEQGTRDRRLSKAADAKTSEPAKFKPEFGKPYSHPYYWAPFILIGNWK